MELFRDHRKRGLAVVIASITVLICLVFLSVTYSPEHGNVFFFEWRIKLFCANDGGRYCAEPLIELPAKWVFIACFVLLAFGIADYMGLFAEKQVTKSKD